jgi:hypothetical protein
MKAKLGWLACSLLASGLGCSKEKSPAEAFVEGYCAEIAKCCSQANLSIDDESCRAEWAALALAGAYSAQAGGACLAEVRAQASAGKFCQSLSQSFPAACATVYGGGSKQQPGGSCRFDSDCAASSEGDVICASANIGGNFVNKCQVLVTGKAGDTPCTATRDGDTFVPYADPNASEVPAKSFVCNLADSLQCRLGTCAALVAIGAQCNVSSDCVRGAYCASGQCASRVAAGDSCAGGDTMECVDGQFCESSAKRCTAKVANGGKCTIPSNCQSNYCLNNSCAEDFTGLASYCGK